MSHYVYHKLIGSESSYNVGFYTPDGEWCGFEECSTEEDAAERVHYLNGGNCNQDCNCNQENYKQIKIALNDSLWYLTLSDECGDKQKEIVIGELRIALKGLTQ